MRAGQLIKRYQLLDFRKNCPRALAFSVLCLTCLVSLLGFANELAGVTGERAAYMIVFLPVAIPGVLFSYLLGLKHPLMVMLISAVVNAALIWSAAFLVQTLISVFLKMKRRA